MTSTVSVKGQVTIPKQIRDRLGIQAGTVLEFADEGGRLVARKIHRRHPVDSVYGVLALPGGVDNHVEALRGPADLP
ncbi:MAG: AbrB/MazE/SpoVT family DNA-binding domain-containing protein [Kineosporiaceae bacterium]